MEHRIKGVIIGLWNVFLEKDFLSVNKKVIYTNCKNFRGYEKGWTIKSK